MTDQQVKDFFDAVVAGGPADLLDLDRAVADGRRRRRGRTAATLGSVAAVVLIVGSLGFSAIPRPAAGPAAEVATPGLRGAPFDAPCFRVDPDPPVTEPIETLVPVNAVSSLTVCRQPGATGTDRTLVPGQQAFTDLVAVLARPNQPTPGVDRFCTNYADSLIQILAHTANGVYWLEIPRDGCGKYIRHPVDPITAAFS